MVGWKESIIMKRQIQVRIGRCVRRLEDELVHRPAEGCTGGTSWLVGRETSNEQVG